MTPASRFRNKARKRALSEFIQKARAENYQFHHHVRQYFISSGDAGGRLAELQGAFLPSFMTILGEALDGWMTAPFQSVCLDTWGQESLKFIHPWYLSADGWNQFQSLWTSLPEPEDLWERPSTVDNLWITYKKLWISRSKNVDSPVEKFMSYPQVDHRTVDKITGFMDELGKLSTGCGQVSELSTALSTVFPHAYTNDFVDFIVGIPLFKNCTSAKNRGELSTSPTITTNP